MTVMGSSTDDTTARPDTFACYKLVDQQFTSCNGMKWFPNVWHMESGLDTLCNEGWLHVYTHPLLAAFLNPIHADVQEPKYFRAEAVGNFRIESGLKVGVTALRITEEILPPHIDQEHRIRLALMVSLEVCTNIQWCSWARNYLEGNKLKFVLPNRTSESEAERQVRSFAWNAATYNKVERNTGMTVQSAAQIKQLDLIQLAVDAYGKTWTETSADGKTVYGQAFNQRFK